MGGRYSRTFLRIPKFTENPLLWTYFDLTHGWCPSYFFFPSSFINVQRSSSAKLLSKETELNPNLGIIEKIERKSLLEIFFNNGYSGPGVERNSFLLVQNFVKRWGYNIFCYFSRDDDACLSNVFLWERILKMKNHGKGNSTVFFLGISLGKFTRKFQQIVPCISTKIVFYFAYETCLWAEKQRGQ